MRTALTPVMHYITKMNDLPSVSENATDLSNSPVSAHALSVLSNLLNALDASDPINPGALENRKLQLPLSFGHQKPAALTPTNPLRQSPSTGSQLQVVGTESTSKSPIKYSPVTIFEAQDNLETILTLPTSATSPETAQNLLLQIHLSTDYGLLSLGSTIAKEISIHGSVRVLDAAIKGLRFVPNASFFGLATLTFLAREITSEPSISFETHLSGSYSGFQETQKIIINAVPIAAQDAQKSESNSRVILVTSAMLQSTAVSHTVDSPDVDTNRRADPRDIYTLLSVPNAALLGKIHRQGVEIRTGDSFCQQDLEQGLISYTQPNNASALGHLLFDTTDRFGISLPAVFLNAPTIELAPEKSTVQPVKFIFDLSSRHLFIAGCSEAIGKTISKHRLRLTVNAKNKASVTQTYELITSVFDNFVSAEKVIMSSAELTKPTPKPSLSTQISALTENLQKKSPNSASITLELLDTSSTVQKSSKIVGESIEQLLANWTKISRITQSVPYAVETSLEDLKMGELTIPAGLINWIAHTGRLFDALIAQDNASSPSTLPGDPSRQEARPCSLSEVCG
jgi:hypothetical protein